MLLRPTRRQPRRELEKRRNSASVAQSPAPVRSLSLLHHLLPSAGAAGWLRTAALLSAVFVAGGCLHGADLRFSVALDPADKAACGLARLTSDQVAVLDALVRRDTVRLGAPVASSPPEKDAAPAAAFSQRLTSDEQRTAGLGSLNAGERSRLDAAVDRFQNARLARSLLAPPSYAPRREPIVATERRKEREIHGSFSLSYGVGSGGYREKSGSMVLHLDDPAKGYAISIGYTETHTKGGLPYYLYRDPTLERPSAQLDGPPRP
jgi:hypothetical protein